MHTLSFVAKNARRRAFCASIIRVQCSTSYKSYWCLQVVNSLSGNLWQPPVQLYCSLLKQQVEAVSGHLLKGQDLCLCLCLCLSLSLSLSCQNSVVYSACNQVASASGHHLKGQDCPCTFLHVAPFHTYHCHRRRHYCCHHCQQGFFLISHFTIANHP